MTADRRITIDNGKYTFVLPEGDHRVHVLRHGEPWLLIEQGSKAIWSLVYDAIDDRALVEAVKAWAAAPHSGRHGELISALWKYQEERGEKQVTPPFEAAPLTAGLTPDDVAEARRIHEWCVTCQSRDLEFGTRRDIQRLVEKIIAAADSREVF